VIRNGAYWKIGYQYVFFHHNGMPQSKHVVARKGASFDGLAATVLLTYRSTLFSIAFLAYYSFYAAPFSILSPPPLIS
jgi:hypothetical protein